MDVRGYPTGPIDAQGAFTSEIDLPPMIKPGPLNTLTAMGSTIAAALEQQSASNSLDFPTLGNPSKLSSTTETRKSEQWHWNYQSKVYRTSIRATKGRC